VTGSASDAGDMSLTQARLVRSRVSRAKSSSTGTYAIRLDGVQAAPGEPRDVAQLRLAEPGAVEELLSGCMDAIAATSGSASAYRLLTAMWDRLAGGGVGGQ